MKSQGYERETLQARVCPKRTETFQGSILSIIRGQRHRHREKKILRRENVFLGRVRIVEEKSKINESYFRM